MILIRNALFFLWIVATLFSCKLRQGKQEIYQSFGGAWQMKDSSVLHAAIIKKDTVYAQYIGAQQIQEKISFGQIKRPHIAFENKTNKNNNATTAKATDGPLSDAYFDAKHALMKTMVAGFLYFLGYTAMGMNGFSILMWMAAFDSILFIILGVAIVVVLFFAIVQAIDSLKSMKQIGDFRGKQFSIIALLASVLMLISMAPMVLYTLYLIIIAL
jgi:hypothetical protein